MKYEQVISLRKFICTSRAEMGNALSLYKPYFYEMDPHTTFLLIQAWCCNVIPGFSKSSQHGHLCYSVLAFRAASSLRRAFFSKFRLVKDSCLLAA